MLIVKVLLLCGAALVVGILASNTYTAANTQIIPTTTLTPTPSSVECEINGIKTTAINQEVCDQWRDFTFITSTPTPYIKKQIEQIQPTNDACVIGDKTYFFSHTDCAYWQNYWNQQYQEYQKDKNQELEQPKNDFENWMNNFNNATPVQPTVPTHSNQPIYIFPTQDPDITKKCIDNINADLKAKMAGCSYFGGGSASFQCEESYRREAETAKLNCN